MSVVAVSVRPSEFGTLVRRRAWDWLIALQRRLGVDRLQLVDENGSPLIPEATGPLSDWPEVTPLIERALHSRVPESIRIGQAQLTCVGLQASERKRGALLLARAVTDATASEARTELELIGSWLRPAIEAHVESVPADVSEHTPRVSALFRVLSAAATTSSESALLRLYADALAIWHDVDLRAYVEDTDGNLRLAISLPGNALGDARPMLDGNEVSIGAELTRVSGHDLEALGFRGTDEAMAARVGDVKQGLVWLLVLSGSVDIAGETRLTLYTDVVRQALQHVGTALLLQVEVTVWQTLINAHAEVQKAVEAALHEIERTVNATTSALSVDMPEGTPILQVGDLALLADVGSEQPERLTATARVTGGTTVVLALRGLPGHFFTSRDREIVDNLGQLVGSWAASMWQRASPFDRRAASRPFEEVLEQAAAQAAARGTSSSVVVIRLTETAARQPHQVVTELRLHVRAGESVGVLGTGEIGLLIYDSTPEVARAVVGRLRRDLAGKDGQDLLAAAAVGVAHCAAGSASVGGLVRAARKDAQGSARSSRRGTNPS